MRDHHSVEGTGNGGFDIARVHETEDGDDIAAHHFCHSFGRMQLVRFGVAHLQYQIDTGQEIHLFDAIQGVGYGTRNGDACLLKITRQRRQVSDGQIQRRVRLYHARHQRQQHKAANSYTDPLSLPMSSTATPSLIPL